MTPDDFASGPDDDVGRTRARQNVILELGFFMAKLGRGRICILKAGELEIPSDIQGVVYIEMDDKGAWQIDLARELRTAGLPASLDRL